MDETSIVIMSRNKATGLFEAELGSYKVSRSDLIERIYVTDGLCHVTLTTDRDAEDWEFEAILDCYETESLLTEATDAVESGEGYNPSWNVTFEFSDDISAVERKLAAILALHEAELSAVYELIKDLRDEYED